MIKEAKSFGNGAQILVSKEWIGKKVILELKEKTIDDIKEDILSRINDLNNVASIVLIGSYARNEQSDDSDIDVVIFTNKKLEIKIYNYHIILININRLDEEISVNPPLFKSILDEGIVILNESFLKNINIKDKYIKEYKKQCLNAYFLNKEFIESDKKYNMVSESVVYSIILRLRSLFILKNKYSFKEFKNWLIKTGILKFDDLYNIYKAVRDDKETKGIDFKLIAEIEKANNLLAKESK